MSMTFALGTNGDLSIVGGKLRRVTGADEVRQRILVTLRHFYGEYFLNLPGGVPWYELILGSKDTRTAESVLRMIIQSVPGVTQIISFSASKVSRDMSISATVEVQSGSSSTVTNFTFDNGLIIDGGPFDGPVPPLNYNGGTF